MTDDLESNKEMTPGMQTVEMTCGNISIEEVK